MSKKAAKNLLYKDKFSKTVRCPKLTWNLIYELTGAKIVNNNSGKIIPINNNDLRINVNQNYLTATNILN